jgi:hypothetical protein
MKVAVSIRYLETMQRTRRAHAQQPVLFSEHLILTAPVTGTQTCVVFYTLKRSLPVAAVRINFFFCK